tara:strand:+ start:3383 stop:3793 length:411 start_codon:yes stop_codon:yes gene_type:complete
MRSQKVNDSPNFEKWQKEFLAEQKKIKTKWAWQFFYVIISLLLFAFVARAWFTDEIHFWGRDYQYTEAIVTETRMRHIGRGYYMQRVYYEFQYQDTNYSGSFQAGKRFGRRDVGDKLKVKFLPSDPACSKVVGFYK